MNKEWRVEDFEPYYTTDFGAAYLGDSMNVLKKIRQNSVHLIMTSPPFALQRKKRYGNVKAEQYVE